MTMVDLCFLSFCLRPFCWFHQDPTLHLVVMGHWVQRTTDLNRDEDGGIHADSVMWRDSSRNLLLQVLPSSRRIYPSKHWHTKESLLLTQECSQPWSPTAQGSDSENPVGIRNTEEGNDSYISDLFHLIRHFRHLKSGQCLIPQCTFQNRKCVYEQKLLVDST